jgi:hypothetical protein
VNEKTKITLTSEQETLLITLYAKAQPGNPLFFDPQARVEPLSVVDNSTAEKWNVCFRGWAAETVGNILDDISTSAFEEMSGWRVALLVLAR